MDEDIITLGGGCFWCTEAVYEQVQGVLGVQSGYSNGHLARPSYEQVCSGDTGHPTTLNLQGNDVGTQYRSGIYWHRPEQADVARAVLAEANERLGGRVVTELAPEQNYWPAEDYHQHYFANHPGQGYCAFVVAPKVEKFRKTFAARVRRD